MKTIFIFAYYSYGDPVFQSAVLPYFENFPDKEKYKFVLLTFEQDQYRLSATEVRSTKQRLADHRIIWYHTEWHSGRFKALKKAVDFCWGTLFSLALIAKYRPQFIYSEGFPGAIIAHYLCGITRRRHIVHTFEPHADYMVQSGVWKETSWETRIIKKHQLRIARDAFAILTGTQALIDQYQPHCPSTFFHRVPSCVDLNLFSYDDTARKLYRQLWGITDDTLLLVYLGKFGGMYWEGEVFDFFDIMKATFDRPVKLLIVSRDDPSRFEKSLNSSVIWVAAKKEEVSGLLSAADLAICGIHNIPARRFSSPIKNGEYWACGLPVVIPEGISDDYRQAEEHGIGLVLSGSSAQSMRAVAAKARSLLSHSTVEDIRARARQFVQKDRSIERYKELYRTLFGSK